MNDLLSNKVISVGELWRLFNLSASFFYIAGVDGYFKHINPAFTRILGFSEARLLSFPIIDFIHPDDTTLVKESLKTLAHNKEVSFCCRIRTIGNTYRWFTWSATHPNGDGQIYGAAQDCTDRYEIQEELLHEKINKEKKILEAMLQGQEMEKAEIGKELHDNVNQMLSTVKLYHEMALNNHAQSAEFIETATQILLSAIEEIRVLSKSLVAPGVVDISLSDSIRELIDNITKGRQIEINFQASPKKESLPGKLKIALFRIVQEQLNNILKHSGAKKIDIRVVKRLQNIVLIIQDNGRGFDVNEKKSGIGLKNISSRVKCYNGKMKIESAPGCGCTLTAIIPIGQINEQTA